MTFNYLFILIINYSNTISIKHLKFLIQFLNDLFIPLIFTLNKNLTYFIITPDVSSNYIEAISLI